MKSVVQPQIKAFKDEGPEIDLATDQADDEGGDEDAVDMTAENPYGFGQVETATWATKRSLTDTVTEQKENLDNAGVSKPESCVNSFSDLSSKRLKEF